MRGPAAGCELGPGRVPTLARQQPRETDRYFTAARIQQPRGRENLDLAEPNLLASRLPRKFFWPGRGHGYPIRPPRHAAPHDSPLPLPQTYKNQPAFFPAGPSPPLPLPACLCLARRSAAPLCADACRVRRRPPHRRLRPPPRRGLPGDRPQRGQVLDDAEEGAGDQRRDRARRLLLDGDLPRRRQRLRSRAGGSAVQSGRVQLLDVAGTPDSLRRAGRRAAHRAHPRLRRLRLPLEIQHPGAGEEVQGVRHRPAGVRLEREGAGGLRGLHLDGAGLRLPQGDRQGAGRPRRQQPGRLHDAVHGDRGAGAGPGRRVAQLRRPVLRPRQAGRRAGRRGGGRGQPAVTVHREADQGGLPAGGAGLPLLAVQAAGQGRESLEIRVHRLEQRGRVPGGVDHGADGGPERRRGVLQADVAVHVEPEQVHAGPAAGEDGVPAAAAVGGPGPVGGPGQGGADPGVLRRHRRRAPAGRPLPARRGARAGQPGAARLARRARRPRQAAPAKPPDCLNSSLMIEQGLN